MIVTFLRIVSGLFFLPAIWLASMTFMAQPKSVVDYLGLYPFWMVPALCLPQLADFGGPCPCSVFCR
ncbi:MAG: hypothetical protein IPP45_17125 [Sphingomonadales bacterium]|nr:hypothetical protein [Sphingomonadales bacterium]